MPQTLVMTFAHSCIHGHCRRSFKGRWHTFDLQPYEHCSYDFKFIKFFQSSARFFQQNCLIASAQLAPCVVPITTLRFRCSWRGNWMTSKSQTNQFETGSQLQVSIPSLAFSCKRFGSWKFEIHFWLRPIGWKKEKLNINLFTCNLLVGHSFQQQQ